MDKIVVSTDGQSCRVENTSPWLTKAKIQHKCCEGTSVLHSVYTVNSRYFGHPWDHGFMSVIARVRRNSRVGEKENSVNIQ